MFGNKRHGRCKLLAEITSCKELGERTALVIFATPHPKSEHIEQHFRKVCTAMKMVHVCFGPHTSTLAVRRAVVAV